MAEQTELPPNRKSLHAKADASYVADMEARVAVLEQIAKDTKDILVEMKRDIRDIRLDQRTDFRLLFSAVFAVAVSLAGVMARGFHWF
jgi:hypothetical protein